MSATVKASISLPEAPDALRACLDGGGAIAWSEPLTIPTYAPEDASAYPMFLDHRVYQGSSGRVYPLPCIERISSESEPRQWQAIHLENQYLRLVVLPELGGRIHIGYDKTTDYDFFYRNNVIKPALVGLAGPWIGGGVEFNWPQHHRPATFLPVETFIEEGADGSVTVWCSDHDPFARMKGMHGVRLHPDRAVVELVVRLHNRTSERQTFLWWANVAVRVNDDYQSFFPQDVRYVADHARRAITAFPAADRPYYGVDYPARAAKRTGADRIDFYRNIPVPTSYMIVDSQQEFFGGYDHGAGAGFVHWADRRVSPGKKQWTWGNAPFGHVWDNHLTDEDGPYVELMAGVFTDNQPDFSWLLPGETKTFSQIWYPIPAIGVAHQANPDAAVHVDLGEDLISAFFAVTRPMSGAKLLIRRTDGTVISELIADLEPGSPARIETARPTGIDDGSVVVELIEDGGVVTLGWQESAVDDTEPAVATEPPQPADIASVDELFFTGVHLAQNRHPTRSPLPYWFEALRRDPGDSRANLALADHAYRAGDYTKALEHARTALDRTTRRNANPRDAEPYYLLGLILQRLGATKEAARVFAKASWDGNWAAAAGYEMAQMSAASGRNEAALADIDSLDALTADDSRRKALRIVLLGRLGRHDEAHTAIADALAIDPLDTLIRFLAGDPLPSNGGLLIDLAIDLQGFGEYEATLAVLDAAAESTPDSGGNARPIASYLRAALFDELGRIAEATAERRRARLTDRRWAFPAGLDAYDALTTALETEPGDGVAAALLGTLLYDNGRRGEAVELWERAIILGIRDPVVYRNAGLGAYNVLADDERAWHHYEEAIGLAPNDARLLYERDQLAQRLGHSAIERICGLEAARAVTLSRDDLVVAYAELLIAVGREAEAIALLESRRFQPWEGGEGLVLAAWDRARAAAGLAQAEPPASLGEGRPEAIAPAARRADGSTDYFATSLPELLLFSQETNA